MKMRPWALAVCAALASATFACLLQLSALSAFGVSLISNVGQLLAAALASAACWVASRRSHGQRRAAWQWLSVGTGCWALGQVVWTFYEVVLGREVPFPSAADVGFLAFPVAAGIGLVLWSGAESHQRMARGRDLMDGAIIAVSLLVLSFVTVMAPLVEQSDGSESWLVLALSLAYPVGDVVLATLVLIALVRSQSERSTLALLALGLGGFALADSLFSYMTTKGTYSSADLVSNSGWVFGFLFVAAAGLSATYAEDGIHVLEERVPTGTSWLWLALPYVPLLLAGIALCRDLLAPDPSVGLDLLLGVALVALMLTRQFLAMADNQRLLSALAHAGGQLEHQATHDALTGLPNRTLFARRLDQALLAPGSNVSVLFCDLDNFKPVNDELGHGAGDILLKVVADRLLGCVRATDTVARLGGDEFAILLDNRDDVREVADRVVASMNTETMVLGRPVSTSISVGVAHHSGTLSPASTATVPDQAPMDERPARLAASSETTRAEVTPTPEREAIAALLLRLADTAMYAAKAAGKGRAAVLDIDPVLTPTLSAATG
jgi:diguanylate cyclase (GGDEF)-like protein